MKERYLKIFKVTERDMEKLTAAALAGGGDYSDLYFEYTTYNSLMLKDSEVTSGGFHVDYGVGIRVLCGEKTGYAYSESTAMPDMMAAAKAAAAIAATAGAKSAAGYAAGAASAAAAAGARAAALPAGAPDFYPQQESWRDSTNARFLPLLESVESTIRERAKTISDPDIQIEKIIAKLSSYESNIMIFNSLGELTTDTRPMGSITASVVFRKGSAIEQKTASRSYHAGPELFLMPGILQEIAEEATAGIEDRFAARRPKGGQMPVVMGCGASGILLHEAMGHAFEADFNRKGQSIFTGRIGEQVCSKGINIVDDATLLNNRGACNWDDEGIMGQKTYMVKDGILESYLHDRISAKHFGVAPTGNGRRESFRFNPIPRMRATYMESGDANPSDIIRSMSKGIFVNEFSNGQVKIGEGDFTFYVKSGYMIENGRLTMPVKDINIIGNGPQALSDITMVGNDLKIDNGTWTCGKDQSVPVCCGIPTVLVKNLTVGGE